MAAQSISAAITSITECCLINTVDKQIDAVITIKKTFIKIERDRRLLSKTANKTAREPMTCMDGKMLVLVSTLYMPSTMLVNMFGLSNTTGRRL